MKTLADLKRDLCIGSFLTLLSRYGKTEGKNIGIKRYVIKKNTVGVCLHADRDAKRGAYLDYPKASLLGYDGKTIKIHLAGFRPLTDEEKNIKRNEPKDDKQDEIDIQTDGSTMFYRRQHYYRQSGKFYLFGVSREKGQRLKHGTRKTIEDDSFSDWQIEDDKIKGEIGLVYQIN